MFSNVVLPGNDVLVNLPAAVARALHAFEDDAALASPACCWEESLALAPASRVLRPAPPPPPPVPLRDGLLKSHEPSFAKQEGPAERERGAGSSPYQQKLSKGKAGGGKSAARWEPQSVVLMVVPNSSSPPAPTARRPPAPADKGATIGASPRAGQGQGQAAAGPRTAPPSGARLPGTRPGTEWDASEERWIEHLLWEQYRIRVLRRAMQDIHASIDPATRALRVEGQTVGVVLMRAGYNPRDYASKRDWDTRTLIERSSAIKCPPLGHQLVMSRRVLGVLFNTPQLLERFTEDAAQAQRIRAVLMGRYGLSLPPNAGAAEREALANVLGRARKNPHKFMLVPVAGPATERLTGPRLLERLATVARNPSELSAYVLEERMQSPVVPSHLLRDGAVRSADVILKLSVHCATLAGTPSVPNPSPVPGATQHAKPGALALNEAVGHTVVARPALAEDLDVVSGFDCIGSAFFTQ
eukprot:tig00021043_g17623.t1